MLSLTGFGKRPSANRASERRTSKRLRVSLPAQIVGSTGRVVECSVVDISESGAQLCVRSVLGIPQTFELHGVAVGPRSAKVVRWGNRLIGIKFL